MDQNTKDKIGELADKCENLWCASKLAMPAAFHANRLSMAMLEIRNELRKIYTEVAGENPWE